MGSELGRRDFLRLAACSGAACAFGAAGCATDTAPALANDIALALADYPALADDGGVVTVPRSVTGNGFEVFVRNDGGVYVALSSWCSHEACSVVRNGDGFVCPCHGARFSATGRVQSGPPPQGLESYATEFDGAVVRILA